MKDMKVLDCIWKMHRVEGSGDVIWGKRQTRASMRKRKSNEDDDDD